MTFVLADRVHETTTTEGAGTVDLGGPVTGAQSFVSGIGTTNTTYYVITDDNDWEVGLGTVTSGSPDTLSRDTILASSNGDAAVAWIAGTRNVFCGFPADKPVVKDENGNVGIGVTPEAWDSNYTVLQLGGLGSFWAYSSAISDAPVYMSDNMYYDGSFKYMVSNEASHYQQISGKHVFAVAASAPADSVISWTTALVIDNAGNAGLGVTPASGWGASWKALQIGTTGALYNTSSETLLTNNSYHDGSGWRYLTDNEASQIWMDSTGKIRFGVAAVGSATNAISWTHAITIDASANLDVASSALYVDAASGDLTIKGTAHSSKACAAGYTRVALNYCVRDEMDGLSNMTNGTVYQVAAPASAVFTVVRTAALVNAKNSVAQRTATFNFYKSSAVVSVLANFKAEAYEFTALASGTELGRNDISMTLPVNGGKIFMRATGGNTGETTGYYVIEGYYD